ncbi:MBL fold metallo-hydrolase [Caldilinea sp.]|uniref:MBL fold metallo-hydrolase n=1 Tax=Caldilinea sp. TaxID=2293560 RepID=UPI002BA3492E|nr:MBL fold metallo-hydrolase [Caldilinea sp.]HRA68167.1 MBL fold metallo-hydrolase [Caldilinea sp.]
MKQILPGLWEIDEIGDIVHCYLWEWSGGLTLIDVGMPTHVHTLLDALTAKGYALHNVRRVIITHGDADHMGGVAKLKKATGAVVGCHSVEKVLLEHPSKRVPASLLLRPVFALLRLAPQFNVLPVTPDELYVDGQQTPEGFTVIHTPGHTPGHISLLHREKRFLIVGDALNNRGGKLQLPPPLFTPDMHNAQRSVWKLAKKYGEDFDVMVFGHGPPILQNGGRKVQSLVTQIFSSEV